MSLNQNQKKDTIILSIFWGACSGAALLKNGELLAAISEERFTRYKNDTSFPENSIQWIFKEYDISTKDIDMVALESNDVGIDWVLFSKHKWDVSDYIFENKNFYKKKILDKLPVDHFEVMSSKINTDQYPTEHWQDIVKTKKYDSWLEDQRKIVSQYLNIPISKVKFIEHHKAHAAYSYYTSQFHGEEVLALTIDSWGDNKNYTIGKFDKQGIYKRLHEGNTCHIARIYRYMTLLLGLKPNEHEYKVMGLSPYGKEKYALKALEVFRETLCVDGLDFRWKTQPSDSYYYFRDKLEGIRFDNIAWALQEWTEELIVEWVTNAINKYNINTIVLSGGVSMNIKANGKIAAIPEVKKLFIGGSAGDESQIIGCLYCATQDLHSSKEKKWDVKCDIKPVNNLYLGCKNSKREEESAILKLPNSIYDIEEDYSDKDIAELLAKGKIIARCVDRMEFGQRSLGNRSILADPSHLEVKDRINAAIKNRDFWMPFAPIILDTHKNQYLKNPKNMDSPYMTIGFNTTAEGFSKMIAACHPSDKSARPQILKEKSNPKLYNIMKHFELITQRGALLNTSFNLHGYPIVNTAVEAIFVLQNSDLDCLILNNFLIKKK